MGKRSSNRSSRDSATPPDVASSPAIPTRPRTVQAYLPENYYRDVEDRRRWTPDPMDRAKTVTGNRPRINVKRGPGGRPLRSKYQPNLFFGRAHLVGDVTSRLGFRVPPDVLVCIRRAMRREVLFALKKRKAGAGAKRRRRNEWSNIDC